MSIIGIVEKATDRQANWNEDERSYLRIFLVRTSSKFDGAGAVLQAVGIQRGDSYVSSGATESDGLALCRSLSSRCIEEAGCLWEVSADYGKTALPEPPAENPLNRPYKIHGGFNKCERLVEVDLDALPVVNSAHMPFDPTIVADDSRPVLSITRNEAAETFNPGALASCRDKVNSDTFQGGAAGTVKVSNISFDGPEFENGYWFYVVTYEFEFNPDGFEYRKVLDAGLKELKKDGEECQGWQDILDDEDNAVTSPVCLKSDGTHIPPCEYDSYVEANGPPELSFRIYESMAFSAFGLE